MNWLKKLTCLVFGHRMHHGHLPSEGGPDCPYPFSVCVREHMGDFCLRCGREWPNDIVARAAAATRPAISMPEAVEMATVQL